MKQQPRQLAIAPNNRTVYITSHKPQGRVMSMLKQGMTSRKYTTTANADDVASVGSGPAKRYSW